MSEQLLHVAAASFQAARRITTLPESHPCHGLHGHGFRVRVLAELPQGWQSFPGGESDALHAHLCRVIAPLDYSDLAQMLPEPTDEALARWIQARLELPGPCLVSLHSLPEQSVELDDRGQCRTSRRYRFESAHRLPMVPPGHRCGRMHGHGFEVALQLAHPVDEVRAWQDFARIDELWTPLAQELDHVCLNDLPGLENPTSEVLSSWLWQRLQPLEPALARVSVFETATAGCHFDGERYRIWKERRFEGAVQLTRAPQGDVRRRLHGHSYLLRLHLSAPLDAVMGWTVDYGDVKALFEPVYERLDHHRLDELPQLDGGDPGRVAAWIREHSVGALPELERIDLHHTPDCGAQLSWGEAARDWPA